MASVIRELTAHPERKNMSLGRRLKFALGSFVLERAIALTYASCRQQVFDCHPKTKELLDDPSAQFIIALWHNRLFYSVYSLAEHVAMKGHNILAIISESDDAEFIARCTEKWGAFTARGSSTRGGTKALKKILRYTKSGLNPLITPDGPKGPMYEMKEGLPAMVRFTGFPVIPICFDAKKKWIVNSWDKFIIPKPFSRTVLSYGQPIYIQKGLGLEESALILKERMMEHVRHTENLLS